jgi:hypothetical protein
LKRKVLQAFATDRKRRTIAAGTHIEHLLASDQLSEASVERPTGLVPPSWRPPTKASSRGLGDYHDGARSAI